MNKLLTFSYVGGDTRQLYTAAMTAADGYHVRIFGFGCASEELSLHIFEAQSLSECISGAEVIVLPIPYSTDGITVNSPLSAVKIPLDDIISAADTGSIILGGRLDNAFAEACRRRGARVFDYFLRPELEIMNAIPTAEGAIELAMANTPYTIHQSRCLVVGYGRIGKLLSEDLRALGADVTATARKHSDIAWIEARGLRSCRTEKIADIAGEYDIIFNTVPHPVLDFKVLAATRPEVLIIDLASKPGGVDFYLDKVLILRFYPPVKHALAHAKRRICLARCYVPRSPLGDNLVPISGFNSFWSAEMLTL